MNKAKVASKLAKEKVAKNINRMTKAKLGFLKTFANFFGLYRSLKGAIPSRFAVKDSGRRTEAMIKLVKQMAEAIKAGTP